MSMNLIVGYELDNEWVSGPDLLQTPTNVTFEILQGGQSYADHRRLYLQWVSTTLPELLQSQTSILQKWERREVPANCIRAFGYI